MHAGALIKPLVPCLLVVCVSIPALFWRRYIGEREASIVVAAVGRG